MMLSLFDSEEHTSPSHAFERAFEAIVLEYDSALDTRDQALAIGKASILQEIIDDVVKSA